MCKRESPLIQWLPLIFTAVLAAITLVAYTLAASEKNFVVYLQVPAAALVPAILPVAGALTKKRLPVFLNGLIALHTILACDLGSAMRFYWRFAHWDLLMHGYFGFLAGVTLYVLLLKWDGETLNRFGFFALIFLGTMGCAAVWELFEFTCDRLLGGDAQRIQEALSMGVSPIQDTMTDIVAAAVGLAVFYLGLFADKLCQYPLSKRIYEQVKGSRIQDSKQYR